MDNTNSNISLTKEISCISLSIVLSFSFVMIIGTSNIPNGAFFFVIAFLMPGGCQGLLQMEMLSRHTGRSPYKWLAITAGSSSLGWAIIYVIFEYSTLNNVLKDFLIISDNIPFSILKGAFLGISMGCIIGTIIGGTQWFFARRQLNLFRWLFTTVLCWSIGLSIPLALVSWLIAAMSGLSHIEL